MLLTINYATIFKICLWIFFPHSDIIMKMLSNHTWSGYKQAVDFLLLDISSCCMHGFTFLFPFLYCSSSPVSSPFLPFPFRFFFSSLSPEFLTLLRVISLFVRFLLVSLWSILLSIEFQVLVPAFNAVYICSDFLLHYFLFLLWPINISPFAHTVQSFLLCQWLHQS